MLKKLILFFILAGIIFLFGEGELALEKQLSHNPLKAGLLSAVLPGGGQIYNESYIKAGGIIITEGLLLGYAIHNHQQAKKYYDEWKETESTSAYNDYEYFYEKRDNDIWWLGITIFLSAMDAVTDAYLHDFDYQKEKVRLKFTPQSLKIEYRF